MYQHVLSCNLSQFVCPSLLCSELSDSSIGQKSKDDGESAENSEELETNKELAQYKVGEEVNCFVKLVRFLILFREAPFNYDLLFSYNIRVMVWSNLLTFQATDNCVWMMASPSVSGRVSLLHTSSDLEV